ncbi:MAG: zinc ribbon domain-containing protein [Halobacteriales archaeon]
MSRRRALIAGFLAVVYPGLGHLYLRAWLRALAWFGLAILTAALVIPPEVISAYETGGFSALVAASRDLQLTPFLTILLVRLLNVVDAVRVALAPRRSADREESASCPECGGTVDPQLDFCHWCTAELDGAAEPEQAAGRRNGFFR